MESTYPNESYLKKKVAGLDKITNPDDLFRKSRKLLTQFVNVFNQESCGETRELVEACLITLQKLKEGIENVEENKLQLRDVFDAIDVLFDIGRHGTNPSCSDNAFRCIMGIIEGMEQSDLRKIHNTFLRKLHTLRDFYQQSVSGRVMMILIELLANYIHSFKIESVQKIADEVRVALTNNDDKTLLDLTEWNKARAVELTRCFANHIPGAKFYLLPVKNGTIDGTNLQPAEGSESFITEWNIHTQCLTIESRVNGCDEIQVVRVLFSDIVKYSFSSKDDSPHIQLKLTQNVVKLYTDYIAEIQELQLFLKPKMGRKETEMVTPLDIAVNHIKLDKLHEEIIVDHAPEPPLQTTVAPGRLLNVEQSSNATSWGPLDTTGSFAGELEDGAFSPSTSAITEVVRTDEQRGHSTTNEPTRRSGTVAVHKIANKTVVPQGSKRGNNGCNQLVQDPYDFKNIANDGDSSEVKTQGRKKRASQKSQSKSPLPSLMKRICYNRASSSNKKCCDSTNVAKDDEDIDIAEDSDESWQPDPKKQARLNGPRQPTKRTKRSPQHQNAARPSGLVYVSSTTTTTTTKQGRRVSVTNVEKSAFVPQQSPKNTTQEDPDDSLVEVLQQIRENPIFDAQDSSAASFDQQRKSPPGRCLSYGTIEDVVPSESIQPGMDMVPASVSDLSFEQTSVDNGQSQSGAKLQYVLDNIVAPGVEELARSFGEKVHEATNYYERLVASCDPLFKAMAEKHTLYLEQEQAASRTLDEFLQLAMKYKRARPSEAELEKRITEAAENERLFKMQLSNERQKFKNVVEDAVTHDWDNMKKSYASIIQGALFGND